MSRQIDLCYNMDMSRDLGVQADYVTRAFRKSEEKLRELLQNATGSRISSKTRRWLDDTAALEQMQADRPLKPPGR